MIDRALDMKLREMKHTCNAWCVLSANEDPGAPEQHYIYDERGTSAIVVTFGDRLRCFIKEIREAGW